MQQLQVAAIQGRASQRETQQHPKKVNRRPCNSCRKQGTRECPLRGVPNVTTCDEFEVDDGVYAG